MTVALNDVSVPLFKGVVGVDGTSAVSIPSAVPGVIAEAKTPFDVADMSVIAPVGAVYPDGVAVGAGVGVKFTGGGPPVPPPPPPPHAARTAAANTATARAGRTPCNFIPPQYAWGRNLTPRRYA
ncbi:MAG: hypothetical protein M3N49_13425 [Candidatus Eremiobacteraeota bacterium]|nr:hypothetical protein [Candidatus Eremiobacteraeota bacterium]